MTAPINDLGAPIYDPRRYIHFNSHQAPFGLNKIVAAKHEDLKFRTSMPRALK